jgi:hypothetical protein
MFPLIKTIYRPLLNYLPVQKKKRGRPEKNKEIKEKRKYHLLSEGEFHEIKERMNKEEYNVKQLSDIYNVAPNTIRHIQRASSPPHPKSGPVYRKVDNNMAKRIAEIALDENMRSAKEINCKLRETEPNSPHVHDSTITRTLKSEFMLESGVPRFSFKLIQKINPERNLERVKIERVAYVKELQRFNFFYKME